MSSKGMSWDAAADRKLLLGILKMQNLSVDNEAMAKYMSTDDMTCTPSAVQNRVKKLKAMSKGEGGLKRTSTVAVDDDEGESPTKKGKGKGGKAKKAAAEEGTREEVKGEAVIKEEAKEEDDDAA